MRKKSKERTSCETCAFYVYDDEYGAYLCDMNMDEDDYVRIMSTDIISAHITETGTSML